ncbi:MAG: type I 3-dehydroquinate dehydratase [Pseudomonadota bacterium]
MIQKGKRARGRICVSIAQPHMGKAMSAAKEADSQGDVDVIEIRLDSLTDPAIEPFQREIVTQLLFTNRPTWEGGRFEGPEEDRLALLHQAVTLNAPYVDIELAAGPAAITSLCRAARKGQTEIIVSWHNFSDTPSAPELGDILAGQHSSGAHIGKMVTMAHNFTDVLRVLQLQETARKMGFPLIAFCMGRAGMISRLATLELGGFMTYAAPNEDEATAPGQLTVAALTSCLRNFPHGD